MQLRHSQRRLWPPPGAPGRPEVGTADAWCEQGAWQRARRQDQEGPGPEMNYRIELEPDDNDTFLITCPALPGVVSFGEDDADCIAHGRDAIEEWLAGLIHDGAEIPL